MDVALWLTVGVTSRPSGEIARACAGWSGLAAAGVGRSSGLSGCRQPVRTKHR